MRRTLCISILIIMLFCVSSVFAAGNGDISIYVNNQKIESDVAPLLIDGVTMVPFRVVLNSLGVTDEQILWRQDAQCVQIKTKDTYIFLAVGVEGAIVNSKIYSLQILPLIKNGRVLIPLRFVSEALGAKVSWVGETNSVIIETK